MRNLVPAVCLLALLLTGCRTHPTTHADCKKIVEQVGGPSIIRAAILMHRDDAMAHPNERGYEPSPNVDPKLWHEPIHNLRPIRVYIHYLDVVIVLSETEKAEAGLCVRTPGQSFIGGMTTNKTVEFRTVYNPKDEDPIPTMGFVRSYLKKK